MSETKRSILKHTPLKPQSWAHGKRRAVATLECGHEDWVTPQDVRRGWANCFKRECRDYNPSRSQTAWETAMGMRGYAGSAAEREDRANIHDPRNPNYEPPELGDAWSGGFASNH